MSDETPIVSTKVTITSPGDSSSGILPMTTTIDLVEEFEPQDYEFVKESLANCFGALWDFDPGKLDVYVHGEETDNNSVGENQK